MRLIRFLTMLAAGATMSIAMATPATANGAAESHERIERVDLGNGTTLLRGVTSPEQLADYCEPGLFCGWGYDPNEYEYYQQNFKGCGTFDIPWHGEGWWVNNLSGSTNDRVAMYDFSGDKIYTTPHSPFQDTSADWTDVWTIKTCVP